MAEVKAVAWRYLANLGAGVYSWTRWLDADEKPSFWHTDGVKTEYAYPESALVALREEVDLLSFELDMMTRRHEEATAYAITHRGALRYCDSSMRDAYQDEHHRANRLEAENARLREALRTIEGYDPCGGDECVTALDLAQKWARAALAEKEGGE